MSSTPLNMRNPTNLETLSELSEKSLHQPANADLVTYCPSIDLVALGTIDQQVLIYRLNGQRVYGATQKTTDVKVDRITWKPNGQLLAIAWNDGSVRLVGAESTKVVHQFTTGGNSGITCMGWTSNLTRKITPGSKRKGSGSWSDLLDDGSLGKTESLNLPRDLSQIDIETSLPKLSVLASGGSAEDVFSSGASLDALFRPFDPKDNNVVDVMVVGTKQGDIHLSIYDSFIIGSFKSPVVIGGLPSHLLLHASHENYSTHSLLLRSSDGSEKLSFVPMDLRFVSASSDYLSLLASRSTALHNLLRYIRAVHALMISEWKATQELPGKFLRNINETLEEKGSGDIVQSLYHSVATGHTFPAVKEWLVDELSERGHKRWDKAVTTGLENLRRLVHENMLPALDRCGVILSRFAGIAKFQGSNDSVGFSSQQISLITETIACLHLISSRILMQVADELDLFLSFSAWLRYEIDRLASSASLSPNDDSIDKESAIDHSKVLLYLQTVMTVSTLGAYFAESSEEEFASNWKHIEQRIPIYDLLDKQLQKQQKNPKSISTLSRVDVLCKCLTKQADTIFAQIAEAEKRNVLFGRATDIGIAEKDSPLDMKLDKKSQSTCDVHIAFVPKDQTSTIQIVRFLISIENGVSSTNSVESSFIQLGEGQIKDIKVFDESLLVLWVYDKSTSLLSIPYTTSDTSSLARNIDLSMTFRPHSTSSAPQIMKVNNDEVITRFPRYKISMEEFIPKRIQVRDQDLRNGKPERKRILLVREDGLQYKVFQPAPETAGHGGVDDVSMG